MSQQREQHSSDERERPPGLPLRGKVALVTGAAYGIGRESARRLARAGAAVVVADIAADGAQETVELIAGDGERAAAIAADVCSESDAAAMVAFAVATFGALDIAHNNAGGGVASVPLLQCTEEHWDRVVALNLTSAFLCMKHELGHMVARGSGVVVNTAAAAAYRGSVAHPAYTAAKHGLAGLTKAAAVEVAASGVRVNAVGPGFTATDGAVARVGGAGTMDARARAAMPIGRANSLAEIGAAVVFLSSDAAAGITGVILPVDGGMSAL